MSKSSTNKKRKRFDRDYFIEFLETVFYYTYQACLVVGFFFLFPIILGLMSLEEVLAGIIFGAMGSVGISLFIYLISECLASDLE